MDWCCLSVSLSVCLALTGPRRQRPWTAAIDSFTVAAGAIGRGWGGDSSSSSSHSAVCSADWSANAGRQTCVPEFNFRIHFWLDVHVQKWCRVPAKEPCEGSRLKSNWNFRFTSRRDPCWTFFFFFFFTVFNRNSSLIFISSLERWLLLRSASSVPSHLHLLSPRKMAHWLWNP